MNRYNTPLALSGTAMNTTITSAAYQMFYMWGYSIQIVWTGTPTGVLKLQASSDNPITSQTNQTTSTSFVPTNWTDIVNSSYSVTAAGNYMWNVFDVAYNFVRLVYTDGSGGASTAVITSAVLNAKGL